MFDIKESEGTRRRHQVDTVVEGIGINRITKNIELALPVIDDAFRCVVKPDYPFLSLYDAQTLTTGVIGQQDNRCRGSEYGALLGPARRVVPRVQQRCELGCMRQARTQVGLERWREGRYCPVRLSPQPPFLFFSLALTPTNILAR